MNDFDQRIAALRARFAERCSSDAVALREAWATRDRPEFQRMLHGLAGNAGVFGFGALSASAREIEEALDAGIADDMIEAKLDALLRDMDAIAFGLRT